MDLSFPMEHAKCLKIGLDRNFGEGKSRICSLPDSVLQHILSFLEIKEAVRTSVLSKRWEFLWTSIPKLEFREDDNSSDETTEEFMNFVDKVLLLRDSSDIHTFSLTCEVPCSRSQPRINSWIYIALRHKVQKMFLDLDIDLRQGSFMLPRHLFSCESLEELELNFIFDLRLPYFVYFPNLKILTLSRVYFMDDDSVKRLFSCCPKLEKLNLNECKWYNVKAVYVSAPMLEQLEITVYLTDEDSDEEAEPNCRQFMISGKRLKSFHYTGELISEYYIFEVPSLIDVHVGLYLGEILLNRGRQRLAAYRALKLLRGLANVKSLRLSPSHAFHVFDAADELIPCLPLFHNLNHLEVSCEPLNFDCGAMLKILHNSPHLESIYFSNVRCSSTFRVRDGWQLDPVPPCFLTHLKTIKVEGFQGLEDEINVLKIILKSAKVLERIDLGSKKGNKNRNVILDLFKECMNSSVVLL